jgi:hypothetical protein
MTERTERLLRIPEAFRDTEPSSVLSVVSVLSVL